jgi:hypothetical protein
MPYLFAFFGAHALTATLRCTLAVIAFVACLGSAGTVVLTEPQTAARRYSQDGLEMDLPGDWQPVAERYNPWDRTFRSAATGGEITFSVWLPLNRRGYLGSFDSFIKEWLPKFEERRNVKRLRVSGLEALSFSEGTHRETWIGVPERENSGTVFRFHTTVQPSDPGSEAELMAYERMLASMRIDAVAPDRAGLLHYQR